MFGRSAFLSGEWRDLVLLSWRVEPERLQDRVPRGTEMDLWGGACYISVVGVRFLGLSVLGVPVPLLQDFAQVNLRLYVRRLAEGEGGEAEVRHGARFLKELVPHPVLVAGARVLINEPFHPSDVHYRVEGPGATQQRRIEYSWASPGSGRITATVAGSPAPLPADSLEEFIAERCWGYTPQRDGGTLEYRVRHSRWRIWSAPVIELQGDWGATFGAEWADTLSRAPDHAFVAEGSPMSMHLDVHL